MEKVSKYCFLALVLACIVGVICFAVKVSGNNLLPIIMVPIGAAILFEKWRK